MSEAEIHRMENEGCTSHPDADAERPDRQERQNAEIERLKARLDNVGGGVPLMGREERAIHAVLAMATIMRGALDDFMYADAAVSSDCPQALDRLLRLMQDIIGAIRGVVIIPVEENVDLLLAQCESTLAAMEKSRRAQVDERYRRMAAGMGDEPAHATAN